MKKFTLLLCASLGVLGITKSSAQLQKGNLLVGANIGNIGLGLQSGNTDFSIAIGPKVGWFVQDNVVIGAQVNLGFETNDAANYINYGVGAFGRYYFGQKEMVLMQHARFFAEANVGINGENTDPKGSIPSYSTNGLGLGFGPGVAYFITPNIGLEALLKYDLTVGFGNSTTISRFGLNVGFQIYLPSKKARAIYNDAAKEYKSKMKDNDNDN